MGTVKSIMPAVAAIIFNDRGDVLLQKRRDVRKWGIISGHVEYGETVAEAILREIKEETNVVARVKRFIGVYSSPVYQTYQQHERSVQYVTLYFEAALEEALAPHFHNEETEALEFFPVDALPLDFDLIHPMWLDDALARQSLPFIR